MNKKITYFLVFSALLATMNFIGAAESSGSNTIIHSNFDYAEGHLLNKIKKEESRLKKYQAELDNCKSGEEVKVWMKKVKSSEKKLKNLNEALLGMDLVKSRVNGK